MDAFADRLGRSAPDGVSRGQSPVTWWTGSFIGRPQPSRPQRAEEDTGVTTCGTVATDGPALGGWLSICMERSNSWGSNGGDASPARTSADRTAPIHPIASSSVLRGRDERHDRV